MSLHRLFTLLCLNLAVSAVLADEPKDAGRAVGTDFKSQREAAVRALDRNDVYVAAPDADPKLGGRQIILGSKL